MRQFASIMILSGISSKCHEAQQGEKQKRFVFHLLSAIFKTLPPSSSSAAAAARRLLN